MDNSASTLRFCKKCQCETERYKSGKCKPCVKMYTDAWKAANPEKLKSIKSAWYVANTDRVNASSSAWQAANPDKAKAIKAAWSATNPDKVKAARSAWRVANPEVTRIYTQNYRASKRANGGVLSKGLSGKLFALQKGKCACCGLSLGDNYHLDHIMPIVLGGENVDGNMQLLRQRCNNQKHAKHPVDFMQSRGFLL